VWKWINDTFVLERMRTSDILRFNYSEPLSAPVLNKKPLKSALAQCRLCHTPMSESSLLNRGTCDVILAVRLLMRSFRVASSLLCFGLYVFSCAEKLMRHLVLYHLESLPEDCSVVVFQCPNNGCLCANHQECNVANHACFYGGCFLKAFVSSVRFTE